MDQIEEPPPTYTAFRPFPYFVSLSALLLSALSAIALTGCDEPQRQPHEHPYVRPLPGCVVVECYDGQYGENALSLGTSVHICRCVADAGGRP